MSFSTKVNSKRIQDFQLFTNPLNTYVLSNRQLTEQEGFLTPDGSEVKKADWLELYNSGTFADGSTEEYFVLPNIPQPTDGSHLYLIGKILNSNTVNFDDGHGAVMNFTDAELDSNKILTFQHGIAHINPIIQITDNNGNVCLPTQVVNTVGSTKVKIGRPITGTWKIVAYG